MADSTGVEMQSLAPVERIGLFRQVLDSLTEHIDTSGLEAGDQLPSDRQLADLLGVSRPTVRQAVKVLEGLGRVVVRPGLGTFVADNSHQMVVAEMMRGIPRDQLRQELLAVRVCVELEALRQAVEKEGSDLSGQIGLDDRLDELAEEPDGASLDLTFEKALGRASGNEILQRIQRLVHEMWLQLQISEPKPLANRFDLHEEHKTILRAAETGDLRQAIDLYRRHLLNLELDK